MNLVNGDYMNKVKDYCQGIEELHFEDVAIVDVLKNLGCVSLPQMA